MLNFSRYFLLCSKKLGVSVAPVVDCSSKYCRLFSALDIPHGGNKLCFAKQTPIQLLQCDLLGKTKQWVGMLFSLLVRQCLFAYGQS